MAASRCWPILRQAPSAYETWARDLPDELGSIFTFLVPPLSWDMGDEPLLVVGFVWASPDEAAGNDSVDRLRRASPPDAEVVEPTSLDGVAVSRGRDVPQGRARVLEEHVVDRLDDPVIDILSRRGGEQTWRGMGFDAHHMGGAFANGGQYVNFLARGDGEDGGASKSEAPPSTVRPSFSA